MLSKAAESSRKWSAKWTLPSQLIWGGSWKCLGMGAVLRNSGGKLALPKVESLVLECVQRSPPLTVL